MLRNAYGVLKGVPGERRRASADERRERRCKKLFRLYNEHGLTSIADRNAGRGDLDLYLELHEGRRTDRARQRRPQLQPRAARREQIAKRLDDLPGKDGRGGPTGAGDEWVRIGPIKLFLDGGMLNGTAYMRQPWPKGPDVPGHRRTTTAACCSSSRSSCKVVVEEAREAEVAGDRPHAPARGRWTCCSTPTSSSTGSTPIKDLRFCITHANFPSKHNLERCKQLGVVRRRAAGVAVQGRRRRC